VIPVEVSSRIIDCEGEKAVLSVARDITERKRAEKEIQNKMKQLEDFHSIAVDRELRMIKLKKQMEEMKIKLEKYENT